MKAESVFLNPSTVKVLISKLMKPIWKGILFSAIGPVTYKKNYPINIEFEREVITKTLRGGICGSDLHILHLDLALDVLPTIVPTPDPYHFGHEALGEIIEIGEGVNNFRIGQRVVVQKGHSCEIHQAEEMCDQCKEGNFWLCEKSGIFAKTTPYNYAGGWSTYFKYHENQLFPIPNSISNDQAVLIEPLAVGLRGVLRRKPEKNDQVLIIGAGTIGLCVLASLKAVQPDCDITIVSKYGFQAELAKKLGASTVLIDNNIHSYVKEKTEATEYKGKLGHKALCGGFDKIYDCVGSQQTLRNSLNWTKGTGAIVLIGIDFHKLKLDLNPVWFHEIDLIGSMTHGTEQWKGDKISTYQLVCELLENKKIPETITEVITHRFKLEQFREALNVISSKSLNKAVKVIFDYENL